jgi:RNA polymerase sigma-B factor
MTGAVRTPMQRSGSGRDAESWLRRYAAECDPALLDLLVRHHLPLVTRLARRYERATQPLEDLEQVGALGLVKALERFDPGRGLPFAAYAIPTIVGEIKRHLRSTSWSAHVPRRLQEQVLALRTAVREEEAATGTAPTPAALGRRLGWDVEEVVEVMRAAEAMNARSLDAPEDERGTLLGDSLGAEDPAYRVIENRSALAAALPGLTPVQREVIELRFGRDMKQTEIAARLGCSQMQVSRLLRAALDRLAAVAGHHSRER